MCDIVDHMALVDFTYATGKCTGICSVLSVP